MISGSCAQEDVDAAYASGCDKFLAKPFDLNTLTEHAFDSISRRKSKLARIMSLTQKPVSSTYLFSTCSSVAQLVSR